MTTSILQPTLIDPQDRQQALFTLLLPGSNRKQASRFEAFAAQQRIGLDLLWGVRDETGRIESCVLCVPAAGRTAMLFASPTVHEVQIPLRARLIDHALQALKSEDIDLVQALLPCEDALGSASHREGGLRFLAELVYMELSLPRMRQSTPLPDGVDLVPITTSELPELARVLKASYVETQDCPELGGLRRIDDIIEGHGAVGTVEPGGWMLLRVHGSFEGAILVNRASDGRGHELVYLGLSREVRGNGYGQMMLDHALHRVAASQSRRMTLAVDSRNTPALSLYERTGFRGTTRRHAFIRSVVDGEAGKTSCPPAVDN